MASHRPSAKLVHSCHFVVAAFFTVHSSSLRYIGHQQDSCRSVAGRRWLPEPGVAMQRHIELIGAAWGLGGADPGCAQAPEALIPPLARALAQCGAEVSLGPTLHPASSERRKEAAVSKLCGSLAAAVAAAMRMARLPCVIGGDHTCAGGTWTGVARMLQGELGLIWIDAHMDSHTPGTSHTGRLHGMP